MECMDDTKLLDEEEENKPQEQQVPSHLSHVGPQLFYYIIIITHCMDYTKLLDEEEEN